MSRISVVVLDLGVGNVGSIVNMLRFIGTDSTVARSATDAADTSHMILPGVGAFDPARRALKDSGLDEVAWRHGRELERPLLGICLGMHLLAESSAEGKSTGLGLIEGTVESLDGIVGEERIPHMGWNTVETKKEYWAFDAVPRPARYYFAHSYFLNARNPEDVIATCTYNQSFTAGVARGSVVGVQFHPEKSHRYGFALLKNFIEWDPC